MAQQFEGETADQIWREAAAVLGGADGYLREESRLGPARELLHSTFHLKNPRQRWILSRLPAMNPAFAIVEAVWILLGRNDAALVNFWNPLLPNFAGHDEVYHGAYGYRLRHSLGFDQIEQAYRALESNRDTRQVILQIWDSRLDFPDAQGRPRNADIPCNVCAMPKIRKGKLEWLQVMRSNDLFLGTPHNFVQFTTLQEVVAGWLGVELGSYAQISDSLHLYEKDLGKFGFAPVAPDAHNCDSLALTKRESDAVLAAFGARLDEMRDLAASERRLAAIVAARDMPIGWMNLLVIVAADAARRHGWEETAGFAANACTNPALSFAWDSWSQRRLLAA
jgi:thymidylate synthase